MVKIRIVTTNIRCIKCCQPLDMTVPNLPLAGIVGKILHLQQILIEIERGGTPICPICKALSENV